MNEKELILDLLTYVGLCPNRHNYLVDEDFESNYFHIGEKRVKYSYNKYIRIDRNTEVFYNPINNIKTMLNTFSFYLNKLSQEGLFFDVYYVDRDSENKSSLVLEGDLGAFKTKYYNNLSLAYIEMIYLLNDENQDLSGLDAF